MTVLCEGSIAGTDIDQKGLIDTHYGSIAMRAMREKPADLTVQLGGLEAFEKVYGLSWSNALEQGLVFNAADGAERLGISPAELGGQFDQLETKAKLAGGLYAGKIGDIYVINGFYITMRSAYTEPSACIYYYVVDWSTAALSWGDFRGKVLGATNPSSASPGSVRHSVAASWQELGLAEQPTVMNNGVHASASPFESLAERANWLGVSLAEDEFGQALLAAGIPVATIEAWTKDPTVTYQGRATSVFDLFEDLDAPELLERAANVEA
eukprot:NODE_356_length_1639_cov_465.893939.p1 GENE.NODE_356_length_1639_cov_465.893939~~NODE_356_length_1639_cov_465.893939.p1  ORF type:complete len:268 (-),score=71.82 NODE_356_length_1639_cov_465.893939:314-1117(-)